MTESERRVKEYEDQARKSWEGFDKEMDAAAEALLRMIALYNPETAKEARTEYRKAVGLKPAHRGLIPSGFLSKLNKKEVTKWISGLIGAMTVKNSSSIP